jgi:hypothetical protein
MPTYTHIQITCTYTYVYVYSYKDTYVVAGPTLWRPPWHHAALREGRRARPRHCSEVAAYRAAAAQQLEPVATASPRHESRPVTEPG